MHRNIFKDIKLQTLKNYWEAYSPRFSSAWLLAAIATGAVLLCLQLHFRERERRSRRYVRGALCGALCAAYAVLLIGALVAGRSTGARGVRLAPFWSYRAYFAGSLDLLYVNLFNILLFVPIGFLLYIWNRDLSGRKTPARRTLFAGFLFSFALELMQLIFSRGLAELDDVINNTIGTALGILLAVGTAKIYNYVVKWTVRRTDR